MKRIPFVSASDYFASCLYRMLKLPRGQSFEKGWCNERCRRDVTSQRLMHTYINKTYPLATWERFIAMHECLVAAAHCFGATLRGRIALQDPKFYACVMQAITMAPHAWREIAQIRCKRVCKRISPPEIRLPDCLQSPAHYLHNSCYIGRLSDRPTQCDWGSCRLDTPSTSEAICIRRGQCMIIHKFVLHRMSQNSQLTCLWQ